jgi:hypothetical protein
MAGCLFSDSPLPLGPLGALKLPAGLGACDFGPWQHKPWFNAHGAQARGALAHAALFLKFPTRKWFVVGDDDTVFNPLALAQWTANFDCADDW